MNEPTNVDEVAKKVWMVQYHITNGVDGKYVKSLLGEPSVERTNDDSQQAVWRYDISPIQGYEYDDLNKIDVKGLEQGYIKAQLLVHWSNEDKVAKIELWYTDKDKHIFTYYLNQDGSTAGALYE
jgi:hypothetical protein